MQTIMTTFYSVDSAGNRIMTDILVSGYIHDHEREYEVPIPEDIIGVTFMFWLIQFCDSWDNSLCDEVADINGQNLKLIKRSGKVFGIQSITKGTFEWKIKLITKMGWIASGIIKDDPEILRRYTTRGDFAQNGDGVYLFCDDPVAVFVQNKSVEQLCTIHIDKDTVISISLNMNKKTICYKFDGEMEINRKVEIKGDRYRLVVAMSAGDQEIQLL